MRRFKRSLWSTERIFGYFLLAPAVVLYTLLVVVPLVQTVILSLHRWNGFAPVKLYVGLSNFIEVVSDVRIAKALGNNTIWSALSMVAIILGLLVAVILYQYKPKGRIFLRVCYFLPFTLSRVVIGIVWKWIYLPTWGALNTVLSWVGLENLTHAWLGDPSTVVVSMSGTYIWYYYGLCMVIFLSALPSIPDELYEAARLDGANNIQKFFYITIPQLRNQITMLIILTVSWVFKLFDFVYIMTLGGPYGSSEVMGFLIYVEAFQLQRVGYAAAISIIFAIMLVIGSGIFLRAREED